MSTKKLLTVMNVLAWLAFVGLLIKAGAMFISYWSSIENAQAAHNLYRGLDLSAYRDFSFGHYTFVVGYKVVLYLIQAYVAFLMTRFLGRIDMTKPFSGGVIKSLQQISYAILAIWLIVVVHNAHLGELEDNYGLIATYLPGEVVFLTGLVYVLVEIFKRGAMLQTENELTI